MGALGSAAGVDYELVWWGKAGKKAFDHAQTGHPLTSKHATLPCEQCHKARSYLGNVADCAACHKDEHRGQFAGRACSSCHTEQAWKPVPHRGEAARFAAKGGCEICHRVESWRQVAFDHAQTRYPLNGGHARVACSSCHRRETRNGVTFVRYKPLPTTCRGCHASTPLPAKEGRP